MTPIVRDILELANRAPSGENTQPWRWQIQGDRIDLFDIHSADRSLYNSGNRGSFVAHGAVIENLCAAASAFGFSPRVEIDGAGTHSDHIATVILGAQGDRPSIDLAQAIRERVTNRFPYENRPLVAAERAALLESDGSAVTGQFFLVEREADRARLARAGCASELVLFSHEHLHRSFFDHIRWTDAEEQSARTGMHVASLGLAEKQVPVFRLFSRWRVMRLLPFLPALIAKQNARVYATGSAIGVLSVRATERNELIAAGRRFEHLWLAATRLGLSFQPLSGIFFLACALDDPQTAPLFSPRHARAIRKAIADIRSICALPQTETPILMFRIGRSLAAPKQSVRRPLDSSVSHGS